MSTLTQSPVLETAGAHPVAPAAGRIEFLSRYKGFLAIFVVLIHTGITYGAVGGWDFVEKNDVVWLGVLTTWINALAQSFVLGAFFFISAYFLPRSLRKKGHARFLLDRLVKLGIPYAIYYFLGMPFLIAVAEWGRGQPFRLGLYFNSGPLWFIEALFIFTLVYIVVKLFRKDSRPIFLPKGVPSRALIVAYIAAAAVIGFAVRLVYPAGQAIHNLQLGYFPMYVLLFAAGIKAGEEGWLEKIAEMKIGAWIAPAAVCAASFLPLMVLGGALDSGADAFLGGLTWQSAAYAVWDAVGGTSLLSSASCSSHARAGSRRASALPSAGPPSGFTSCMGW